VRRRRGDIGTAQERRAEHRAGAGLDDQGAEGRVATICVQHAVYAGGRRRAQGHAHVLWIADTVQGQQRAARSRAGGQEIFQFLHARAVYVQGHALVLAAVAGDARQFRAAVLAHGDVASLSQLAELVDNGGGTVAARQV
jgi:hypothetical protein